MKRRLSLRTRFMLVLAAAAVTPTVLLGVLAIRRTRTDLEREVVRGNLALIRSVGRELDGALQGARQSLEIAGAAWAEAPDDEPRTRRLLARIRDEVPVVESVDVFGTDDPRATHIERSGSYGGYVSEGAFEGGRPRTFVVVQARGRTGELLGYVAARLDLGFVASLLGGTRLAPGTELYVVDGYGRLVASTAGGAPGASRRGQAAVDAVLAAQTEGTLRQAGRLAVYRNLSSFSEFRPVRWGVVLEQSEGDAFALAQATARMTALVCAAILLWALFFGAYAAGRLSGPLVALARETGIGGAGDEIGLLAQRLRELARNLARANEFLEDVAQAMPVGVMSVDAGGTLRAMNPAQERLSEVTGAVGQKHDEIFPGDEPPLAPGDRMYERRAHRYLRSPRLRTRVRTSALRGGGFVIVQEDLSDRARLEVELVRAEKLSAVGLLAAGVAHEINNPLTTILGYARLLEEDHPELEALRLVADEARRVQEILRHLLDFSRQEPGEMAPCDLNGVVSRTLQLVRPQLRRRNIELRQEMASGMPPVPADVRRIEQVFVNLATNAAQAMEGGGVLTVRTRLCDGRAAVEFQDTGVGIAAEQLGRVFEPFFTTKGPGVGTGLGLAISREIVSDHGGEIRVESAGAGAGATFRVLLPLVAAGA